MIHDTIRYMIQIFMISMHDTLHNISTMIYCNALRGSTTMQLLPKKLVDWYSYLCNNENWRIFSLSFGGWEHLVLETSNGFGSGDTSPTQLWLDIFNGFSLYKLTFNLLKIMSVLPKYAYSFKWSFVVWSAMIMSVHVFWICSNIVISWILLTATWYRRWSSATPG